MISTVLQFPSDVERICECCGERQAVRGDYCLTCAELESEAIQHRSRAERQRAACARQLDEEAATVEAAIAQMGPFDAAAIRARRDHAASLRAIAAEMRARAVVQ